MGRGLSALQRTALRMALDGSREEAPRCAHTTNAEVIKACYGFPRRPGRPDGIPRFSRAGIGEQRYNAAVAAVSRALARLESRGLVERWRGCVTLTDAGVRVAAELGEDG